AGPSDGQPAVRCAQVLLHVGQQVVADGVGVPVGAGEQVLHTIRSGIAEQLGELPAVLALGVTEQPPQVAHGPLAWLAAREVAADPLADGLDFLGPLLNTLPRRSFGHDSPSPQSLGRASLVTTAVGLGETERGMVEGSLGLHIRVVDQEIRTYVHSRTIESGLTSMAGNM